MKNFKGLKIWQKGFDISIKVFELSKTLPQDQKFGLISQITRAAVSIPSNIAEGSSRTSDKDKNRYIEIALGSCFELETQLLIIQKLGIGNAEMIKNVLPLIDEEQKMVIAYSKTLTC